MIFIIFFRYIIGYVRFKIISEFPEMALNNIKNANINVWNIKKYNNEIYANVKLSDYKCLRHKINRKYARLKIVSKRGVFFRFYKYKRRKGFLLGFVIFVVMLTILPNYIWNVNLSGNEKIPNDEILEVLNELGVYEGANAKKIDSKKLVSELKLKISDISWAAINIEGAVANVEINERVIANVESTDPSNLLASKDGIVVGIKVLSGKLNVKLGDTVRKGDLLVSGISEYKNGKQDFTRSQGEILCRTNEKLVVTIPFEQKSVMMTENVESKIVLRTPFIDIPLFIKAIDYNYLKSTYTYKIKANNNYVPFYLTIAKFYETKENIIIIDENIAISLAENEMKEKEQEMLGDGKIIAKESKIVRNSNSIQLITEYICEKNIAFEEKIKFGTVN